jgi:hypothetical protein
MNHHPTFGSLFAILLLMTGSPTASSAQEKLEVSLERKVGAAINACAFPMRSVAQIGDCLM